MLDKLKENTPIPLSKSFFSLEGIRSRAESYLFQKNNTLEVKVLKSSGRFHLVELKDEKITKTFWHYLRKISYYTPLPLVARLIVYLIKKADNSIAYYDNPDRTTSIFFEYIIKKQLPEVKGVYGLKNEVIQEKDPNGRTPFQVACKEGYIEGIRWLYKFSKGKALSEVDDRGRTPFMVAYEENRVDVARCLYKLSRGKVLDKFEATKKQELIATYEEAEKNSPKTPFAVAFETGNLEDIKRLYKESQGTVLEELDCYARTPFIGACEEGKKDLIKCLYELSKDAVLKDTDLLGRTPFIAACERNKSDIKNDVIECLYELSKGAVLKDLDNKGRTPFIGALEDKDYDCAEFLCKISKGAVLKERDADNRTPLMAACHRNYTERIEFLCKISNGDVLKEKVFFNNQQSGTAVKNYAFETPFIYACIEGKVHVVECIFSYTKAVLSDRDSFKRTPFISACIGGHREIIEYLYNASNGSVLEDRDHSKTSGFIYLCLRDHVDSVRFLYEATNGKILEKNQDWQQCAGVKVARYLNEKCGLTSAPGLHLASFNSDEKEACKLLLGSDSEPVSQRQIKMAFNKLITKNHPDRNPDNIELAQGKTDRFKKAMEIIQRSNRWHQLPVT